MKKFFSFLVILLFLSVNNCYSMIGLSDLKSSSFYFKKKEYSLIKGYELLHSEQLEQVRFFDFTQGFSQEKREYSKDTTKNPLLTIVKILFPSVAGYLNINSQAQSNLAQKVESPLQMALLFNFIETLETKDIASLQNDKSISKIKSQFLKAIIDSLSSPELKKWKSTKEAYDQLLKEIKKVILLSKISPSLLNTPHLQTDDPLSFLKGVISSFFIHRFNTKENILNLLKNLSPTIVSELPLTLDEKSLTEPLYPYERGTPISNDRAFVFNKSENHFEEQTYQDCVETALRHLLNLTFYSHEKHQFVVELQTPLAQQLKSLYEKQGPEFVNDGSQKIRGLWSKFFGDLNRSMLLPNPIFYSKKSAKGSEFELECDLENVLNILYNLLDEKREDSSSKNSLEERFSSVLKRLNPKNTVEVKYRDEALVQLDITLNSIKFQLVSQKDHLYIANLEL